MLTFEYLEQFSAFARLGTLSEVSVQMNISQPTLTRNMQKLEAEFGVPLFTRQRNRLQLNENGKLAAAQTQLLLQQAAMMMSQVRALDKAHHTITVVSCAILPLQTLLARLTGILPDRTIASEIKSVAGAVEALQTGAAQLAILLEPPAGEDYISKKIGEEHLMFCLPTSHPLAGRTSLTLEEMNGENLLMMDGIGFWSDLVRSKMPDSRFLIQTERYSLHELIENSLLPCFATDCSIQGRTLSGRVNIPISNEEVNVSYYLAARREYQEKYPGIWKAV
ncbi:MAG: LysR family transcriptional regulator [Faecalibacterium sp.]